jgi:S-DNA-T family DNA segregation ATPase FtsK/SpoIIIE
MATSVKKKKVDVPTKKVSKADFNNSTPEQPISTSRKIKLAVGLFLLLLGVYFTLSIISYCFSWKQDQNLLITTRSAVDFLFNGVEPVANWCGRLGAYVAHMFVFRAMGIASLMFTLWIVGIGLNLVNGKPVVPVVKWIRWMALGFLFICPLLSFVFNDASFSLGGALGNGLVEWTNGFAGKAGTIIMLLAVFCFFVFIVFQWDIKPLLNSARRLIPAKMPSVNENASEPNESLVQSDDYLYKEYTAASGLVQNEIEPLEVDEPKSVVEVNNRLKDEDSVASIAADVEPEFDLEMIVVDRSGVSDSLVAESDASPHLNRSVQKDGIILELPQEDSINTNEQVDEFLIEEELQVREQEAVSDDDYLDEVDLGIAEEDLVPMAFEVKTIEEEQHIPAHGAHISIQSGEPYDPNLDLPNFKFPTLDLLDDRDQGAISLDREELEKNKNQIILTLRSFGIEIQRISATIGPTVTLYEIVPAEGVRISKIRNLEDDIALNLAALGIRIIAPIPGRGTIGIEVPNTNKQIVSMRTLLSSEKFVNNKMSLPIALGKKIDNENYIVDLATMPHLLMAGATGQGKSVGINAILVSLLYKKHPSQLKFVMVDPKKVELSVYRLIEKHYLAKLPNEEEAIITDTKKVINTVNALCIEMDNRYELLKDAGARNIKEYNDKFIRRKLNPNNGHKYLPFIVLVIDEFADLIMTAGKEVEMPVARLAQLARAVGIHIIIATQRPSVNVITGIIKANFPARIAFKVSAKVDSRTILDSGGAEQLIGRGDMLVSHGSELLRLQCAFVDTPEVERIVEYIGTQIGYPSAFELPEYEGAEDEREAKETVDLSKRDKMFDECARLVVNSQSGSTSMLQRKFNLGYNRAGRIMDQLEAAGIVGAASGSKPRDVLITTEYELDQHLQSLF